MPTQSTPSEKLRKEGDTGTGMLCSTVTVWLPWGGRLLRGMARMVVRPSVSYVPERYRVVSLMATPPTWPSKG